MTGTNKHFPKDLVSLVTPVNAIRANRPFIAMQLDNRSQIQALFDTGACVSLVSRRSFNTAKRAGAVGEEIKDHGVTLCTASGGELPTVGAFFLTFTILNRTIKAPVIVAEPLNGEAIIGMNIIEQEGLMYDPFLRQCRFSDSTPPESGWVTASIQVTEDLVVQPLQARLARCVLRKSNGDKVGPHTKFVGTLLGLPVAAVTDRHGAAKLYLANPGMEEMTFQRKEDLGLAEEASLFEEVELTENTIACIFASLNQPETSGNMVQINNGQLAAELTAE